MLWLQLPSLKKTLLDGAPGCGHLPTRNPAQLVRPCWVLCVHEDTTEQNGKGPQRKQHTVGNEESRKRRKLLRANRESEKFQVWGRRACESKGESTRLFLDTLWVKQSVTMLMLRNIFKMSLGNSSLYTNLNVLRLSYSNSSNSNSGFPLISVLGFTLWR